MVILVGKEWLPSSHFMIESVAQQGVKLSDVLVLPTTMYSALGRSLDLVEPHFSLIQN